MLRVSLTSLAPDLSLLEYLALGWQDPLEAGMATHSGILAWRIPIDRGAWWATIHGVAELDMAEQLSTHITNQLLNIFITMYLLIYPSTLDI